MELIYFLINHYFVSICPMSLRPSYVYPFNGIIYLLTHPSMWKPILFGILLMIIFSLFTSIAFFVWIFPLQSLFLSSWVIHWLSWVISFLLTLFEIGIVILLFSCLYLSYYMGKIYTAVWNEETITMEHNRSEQRNSLRISPTRSFLFLLLFRVFLFILTAPLNLIPILGTMIYIYINGYYYAWSLHYPYFDAIGLSFQQGFLSLNLHWKDHSLFFQRQRLCGEEWILLSAIWCHCCSIGNDSFAQSVNSNNEYNWKCFMGVWYWTIWTIINTSSNISFRTITIINWTRTCHLWNNIRWETISSRLSTSDSTKSIVSICSANQWKTIIITSLLFSYR